MTYLLIALGVLREIGSREPQCFMAVATGLVGLLLTTRLRLAVAAHIVVARPRRGEAADRRVTASVR